jgi:hypothetical protein
MKTAIRILIVIIPLFAFQLGSFNPRKARDIKAIEASLDSISLAGLRLSGLKLFSTTERDVYAKVGKPDSISIFVDECGDRGEFKRLHYGKDVLYTHKGKLYDFDIATARFKIDYQQIKVGDPRDKIRRLFPKSYEERFEKGADNQTIDIQIDIYDSYLKIFVDKNKVTGFMTWEPC